MRRLVFAFACGMALALVGYCVWVTACLFPGEG